MGTPPDRRGAGLPKTPKGTPSGRESAAEAPGRAARNPRAEGRQKCRRGPTAGRRRTPSPSRRSFPCTPAGVPGRRTAERRASVPGMRTERDRADAPIAAPRRGGTQPNTWKRDRSPGQHRPTGADGPTPPRGDAPPRPRSRSHTGGVAAGGEGAPPGTAAHAMAGPTGSRPERLTVRDEAQEPRPRTPRSGGSGRRRGEPPMPRRPPSRDVGALPRTPGALQVSDRHPAGARGETAGGQAAPKGASRRRATQVVSRAAGPETTKISKARRVSTQRAPRRRPVAECKYREHEDGEIAGEWIRRAETREANEGDPQPPVGARLRRAEAKNPRSAAGTAAA